MTMRRILVAATLAAGLMLGGCGQGEEKKASLEAPLVIGSHTVSPPIRSGNVTIYPVSLAAVSASPAFPATPAEQKPLDDVVSLDEAKKNGWIEIREGNSEFEINSVSVTNNGPKKILLMTGELLIGGHQDRVVGKDTVVEPGQTVEVPVFCVEQGRSTGPTDVFTPADHSVPMSVRMAAIGGEQTSVWSNVDGFNVSAGHPGGAQSVKQGLSADRVKDRVKSGFDHLWAKIGEQKDMVGAVVVIDGKIRSLEIFGAPAVFRGGMPTILRGALSEAAVSPIDADRAVSEKDLKEFLGAAMRKIERESIRNGKGSINSSVMAGYFMSAKKDPVLVHGTFINAGR